MVAEMKGTPAVHCCLEVDEPQKNSCHKAVSTCLPDLGQLRGGKLSALKKLILPKEALQCEAERVYEHHLGLQ